MELLKFISLKDEGEEIEMTFSMLVAHLRQKEMIEGIDQVIIQIGAWRLLVRLLGDTSEDVTKQLLK